MSTLAVRDLTRKFGKTLALDHVSFALPEGGIYGFIGPNGSGKTTCLRIMAGLDEPDEGGVLLDGADVTCYPERLHPKIALMPDTLPDSADIRVWEYLDYFCRAFGLKNAERAAALEHASSLTNLSGLYDKFLAELSKGMKQQVSLARVLLHEPDILLLDEPAAGLDPRARVEFRETLFRIARGGRTVFISSHILSELEDMIQGVALIEKGRLLRFGSVASVVRENTGPVCRALLEFPENAESYLEQVKAFPLVESAEAKGPKQLIVTLKGGAASFKPAMAEFFRSDLPLCGVSRPDLGLEGLFMNVTEKGGVQ